jgi:hypothetical protein
MRLNELIVRSVMLAVGVGICTTTQYVVVGCIIGVLGVFPYSADDDDDGPLHAD